MNIATPFTAPDLPTSPVWHGSEGLTEQPYSPLIELSRDGLVYTRKFSAPWSVVMANIPVRFAPGDGTVVPTYLLIDTVRAQPGPGGTGTLTITYCQIPTQGVGDTPTAEEETDWVEVQRPLKSHKMFQSGGDSELELTDLAAIQIWQNQNDPVLMGAFQYQSASGAILTLTENAITYATKWLRGQEFYSEYAPVIKSTLTLASLPESGGCGLIGTPGVTRITPPTGYTFLKTADRCLKEPHAAKRIQEWTGAWWIDPDIYGTADTGGSDGGGSDGS